jgi:hypothetical protein
VYFGTLKFGSKHSRLIANHCIERDGIKNTLSYAVDKLHNCLHTPIGFKREALVENLCMQGFKNNCDKITTNIRWQKRNECAQLFKVFWSSSTDRDTGYTSDYVWTIFMHVQIIIVPLIHDNIRY